MTEIITSCVILLAKTNQPNNYVFGAYKNSGEATGFVDLPEDHKRFVEILRNHQTIMGASTLKATPDDFPDGGRYCVTHHPENVGHKAKAVDSIERGIALAKVQAAKIGQKRVFVVGGASIIEQCLEKNLLDEIELTLTHDHQKQIPNPVYLQFDLASWEIVEDSGILVSKDSDPKDLKFQYLLLKPKQD